MLAGRNLLLLLLDLGSEVGEILDRLLVEEFRTYLHGPTSFSSLGTLG
jgi:hypothetical protein